MGIHKNEKDELRLWAKNDIVPRDLQELCKQAATSIAKLQERIKEFEDNNIDFTKEWRIKHGEPLNYNERIVNSACDIIDRQTERITELEEGMRDVCDLINKRGVVSKWKVSNWLKRTLKG